MCFPVTLFARCVCVCVCYGKDRSFSLGNSMTKVEPNALTFSHLHSMALFDNYPMDSMAAKQHF